MTAEPPKIDNAPGLTHERLRECIFYNPEDGIFTWVFTSNMQRRMQDKSAGHRHHRGYILIEIDGCAYAAHRLAWFYMTGEWPSQYIDHINLDKSDNRFENLREATRSQNSANRTTFRNNKSGFKGVRFDTRVGKWQARILGRHIGYFKDAETAHAAYCASAQTYFGEFARGV